MMFLQLHKTKLYVPNLKKKTSKLWIIFHIIVPIHIFKFGISG